MWTYAEHIDHMLTIEDQGNLCWAYGSYAGSRGSRHPCYARLWYYI